MAKKNEPTPANPNTTLLVMAAGGLAVAGLVGWALTRQVEPDVTAPSAAATSTSPSAATSTALTTAPPATESEKAEVARISVEDLKAKFDRGEVTIIDVRDADSFTVSHIPGALHIPLARIQGEIGYIPKAKPIVTYCT